MPTPLPDAPRTACAEDAFADAVPHPLWVADAAGRTRRLNRSLRRYLGESGAHPHPDWWEAVHPDDRPAAERAWAAAVTAAAVFEAELRLRRHDGAYTWHAVRAEFGSGRWLGVATDVDARRRAEEEARAAGARLNAALDALPAAAYTVDADGLITHFNARAAEAWGRSPRLNDPADRYCGSHRLFTPAGAPVSHDRCWMAVALASGEPATGRPIVVGRPDGTTLPVLAHAAPLPGPGGAPGGGVNVLVEATDGRRAEAMLRAAMEGSLDAVFVLACDRGPDGRVADFRFADLNRRGAELLARPRHEVVGRRLCDLLPVNRTEGFFDRYVRVVETGEPLEEEFPVRLDGVTGRWLRHQVAPAGDGVIIATRDVTAQRAEEAARRRAESLTRLVWEHAADGIRLTDADGVVRMANPAYCRLVGRPAAEVEGRSLADAYAPARRAGILAEYRERFAAGTVPGQYEAEVELWDGRGRWFEVACAPLDTPGEPPMLLSVFRDVTDRKRAEAELRAAEAALRDSVAEQRLLFDANPHPMWVYDRETLRFLAVNDAAVERYGYARAEFHAMTIADIRPAAEVPALVAAIRAGGTTPGVWRHRWKDGTAREVEVAARDIRYDGRAARLVLAADVTERRAAERALREREELLRTVIATIPCGVFWKDRNSVFLGCNDLFARNHGLGGPDAVVGRTDYELGTPAAEAGGFRAWDRVVIESGEPVLNLEEARTRTDGSALTLLTSKVPLRDAAGAVVGVLGIYQDITARKRAEDELRRRDERLSNQQAALLVLGREVLRGGDPGAAVRRATETAAGTLRVGRVSVWRYTADRRALRCADLYEAGANRHAAGAELAAGAYPAYFAALAGNDVIAADDAAADPRTREFAAGYLPALGIGAMLDVPLRADGRTDGVLCCEHVGPPRRWEADEQVFAMAVGTLVSLAQERWERERAEDAARALHTRYETAVTATGQVLYDWDVPTGRLGWGGSCEVTLGYAAAELPAHLDGWVRLIHPDDRPAFDREVERARATGAGFRLEYRVRRRDGALITVSDHGHFLPNPGGRPHRVVGFVADVTDRKQLEEQFRQSQKMDAVGRLAGGVAHDFNNLLTVINGYADLLLDGLPDGDPGRPLVAEVRRAGERSAGLTRQLLAFSRRQVLQPKVLDLNAVVADAGRLLRRVIGEDVRLATDLAPGVGPVRADPGQLEQVLVNLAVNARDAMPTGGTLTITTRAAAVGDGLARAVPGLRPGPFAVLEVSDTGCGMTDAVKARLFEPFFTTKEVGKGTGLGLATVFGIVQQSGGAIDVDTAPGAGASFRVYLPVTAEPAPAGLGSGSRTVPGGTETVLLVEDEPGVRGLAERVLARYGYAVLAAADGAEAEAVAARHPGPIHLILTDVVMPGAGGPEVAERVRARHPGARVLFMSGYTDDAVVRHGVESARVNFLQKPFAPPALALKVREVLDAPAGVT